MRSKLTKLHNQLTESNKMKDRNRYLKIVEWSEEDQCYVGSVPGWIGACCHGDDEEKVYHQLCRIIDEWIEIYKKDGKQAPLLSTMQIAIFFTI